MKFFIAFFPLFSFYNVLCNGPEVTMDPSVPNEENYSVVRDQLCGLRFITSTANANSNITKLIFEGKCVWDRSKLDGKLIEAIGIRTLDNEVRVGYIKIQRPDGEEVKLYIKEDLSTESFIPITEEAFFNTIVNYAKKSKEDIEDAALLDNEFFTEFKARVLTED